MSGFISPAQQEVSMLVQEQLARAPFMLLLGSPDSGGDERRYLWHKLDRVPETAQVFLDIGLGISGIEYDKGYKLDAGLTTCALKDTITVVDLRARIRQILGTTRTDVYPLGVRAVNYGTPLWVSYIPHQKIGFRYVVDVSVTASGVKIRTATVPRVKRIDSSDPAGWDEGAKLVLGPDAT